MKTTIQTIEETYEIRDEAIKVSAKARFNCDTGEQVFDEDLDNVAINLAFDKYRTLHNMITPPRIKQLRHIYGLSQRDFAALLGWSATTVATYETGALPSTANSQLLTTLEQRPTIAQSMLATAIKMMTDRGKQAFQVHMSQLDAAEAQTWIQRGINSRFVKTNGTEFAGYGQFDFEKFTQLVLYFVTAMPLITTSKLNKLLFYTDFKYFAENTVSITGTAYLRLPHGPAPESYQLLYGALESAHCIETIEMATHEDEWTGFKALVPVDEQLLTAQELAVMADTVARFSTTHDASLTDLTHQEPAWQHYQMGEPISYLTAATLSTLNGDWSQSDDVEES
ncbi:type II TA system antitoxin MqsA family protein [Lactiplantibacillus fabifermentans]|uniref:HTH cro/C1-type domain-containing protein n=2 Tax=Lactiplantibacillus fabifermentans TaxID=483011 RepID=W6TA19_9LACO|nr:type II TA system antitoxin MqsA family protein [Lactiplantibacillus fabifermentans]ETY74753.1 hypothetical protein LFAB_05695 [Lactiplantibacillus fabifermentans T30PCM01]KRO26900.1 putative PHAGE PROTEIN [Lactiplantibacillus fabifermentans DSM 21115]